MPLYHLVRMINECHTFQVRKSNSGHLYADKSEISKCDMMATNGVVHQIESLLTTSAVTNNAQERIDTFTNIFNFNPFELF